MTGVNLIQSQNNGYIASTVHANVFLQISQFDICVDSTPRFGYESAKITVTGIESVRCDVCDSQSVVYGLCRDSLTYSELVGGMYQCVPPFEYADNKCVCAYGYLLNDTQCVNVVDAINDVQDLVNDTNADQMEFLEQNLESVQNFLIQIDQSIASNFTDIDSRIISNYTLANQNLFLNTSVLDARIFANISDIKHDFYISQIKADTNLLANTTVLDQRIFNNFTLVNTIIQNISLQLLEFNVSLQFGNQIIEYQLEIINNLSLQINCSKNTGYSLVNGSCVKISCSLMGQQSVNGVCQCLIAYQVVLNGECVCPENSTVNGGQCVCKIVGQTIHNGVCGCKTMGAYIINGECACGQNSVNVSDRCVCPGGANLVNGICKCTNVNAYISGNSCVCPTYSSLIENTCTCPSNSQIINNICSCYIITGQIMNNGVCTCITSGAFVYNGVCVCGEYALNTSNKCTCPDYSSLINNICECDIKGQQIINQSCQCQSGQSIINDTCQISRQQINITGFECSQEVYIINFDVQSITNQINTSTNFSSGYVFSASALIQNAFIDISDHVYTTIVNPLFQSQNTFQNSNQSL
ncbi:Conserved_hypothetical protein [Hexamita inflata]|uniref:EGF-like domain-containing protein n=1 Tax=Hexamita inflata TaxID=28002 RepID=A0AA86NN92_9EUKA|nr:Conserved hypothetical protein [Hexamita inflata]